MKRKTQEVKLRSIHWRKLWGSVVLPRPAKCCSRVQLCETLWAAARQPAARQPALSVGFSRQEYWGGLPCPALGNLPDPGIEPTCVTSNLHWQAGSWPGKPSIVLDWPKKFHAHFSITSITNTLAKPRAEQTQWDVGTGRCSGSRCHVTEALTRVRLRSCSLS